MGKRVKKTTRDIIAIRDEHERALEAARAVLDPQLKPVCDLFAVAFREIQELHQAHRSLAENLAGLERYLAANRGHGDVHSLIKSLRDDLARAQILLPSD